MDKISTRHIPFFILATTMVSIKTYPTIYTKNGGRESWVALIVASAIFMLFVFYIIKSSLKQDTFNLYEIYTAALGKTSGNIFILLLLINLFFTLVEGAAVFSNSLHNHMLINTPIWYFLIFFVPSTLYTVKKGVGAIITVTLIGITLITISGINLALLTAQYKRFEYLFPIFDRGVSLGFIKSVIQILGLYGTIIAIFPLLQKIDNPNKTIKYTIYSLLFAIQIHIVSLTGLFMTFDVDFVNFLTYPNLFQTQLVSHFRFLEMGEMFVMLQIVGGWYLKYVITFYAILSILREMKMVNPKIPYYISAIVYVCGYYAGDNLFRLFRLLNVYSYISFISFIIIPWLVFCIFSKKEIKSINNNSSN